MNKNKTFTITLPINNKSPIHTPHKNGKANINVSKLVKDTCSIFIVKGRINNTASKLLATKNKCTRMAKEV